MESQLTLRLPTALAAKLERTAKQMKSKRSVVVRLALEQFLDARPQSCPIDRVRDLLGSVDAGVEDLGQRHREHMIRRLRRNVRTRPASLGGCFIGNVDDVS